jgi:hypothetical protein
MAIGIGIFLLAAAQAGPVPPRTTHLPDIEARLAKLVGDWTIEGQEATYRETCAWYGPRAFIVCDTVDQADGYRGRSILGYSKDKQRFTYHNYGFSGSSRSELGFPHGSDGIVYTDERPAKAGLARVTTWVEPHADGRLRFRQAHSVNGGAWEQTADFHYVRRK